MKELQYEIEFKTNPHLLTDFFSIEGYRKWAFYFDDHAHYIGEFAANKEIFFRGKTDTGIVAKIVDYRKDEFIKLVYIAEVHDGKRIYFDPSTPYSEEYSVKQTESATILSIKFLISDAMAQEIIPTWEKLLPKLPTLFN